MGEEGMSEILEILSAIDGTIESLEERLAPLRLATKDAADTEVTSAPARSEIKGRANNIKVRLGDLLRSIDI